MSNLFLDALEPCVMLHKTTKDDPYGGDELINWEVGSSFDAAFDFDVSMEARRGEAQGVTSLYRVTTRRSKTLEYHEVFRRVRDGKIFRVTSDGDDKYTPKSATLDMRQVTAEEYVPVGYVPEVE